MKNIKDILLEYHLLIINKQISVLQDFATGSIIDDLSNYADSLKVNGIKFKEESKGWMKPYFNRVVISPPKLIRNGDIVVGIAMQIGEINGMPDYITYKWSIGESKCVFEHTLQPTKNSVVSKGSYPKKVTVNNFQLSISPLLTHLKYNSDLKLVYEKCEQINNQLGFIKTLDNVLVAVVTTNGLVFDNADVADYDVNQVTDMWKRGIIHKK